MRKIRCTAPDTDPLSFLFGSLGSYGFSRLLGVENIACELQRYVSGDWRDEERISTLAADYLGDLALVGELTRRIDLYKAPTLQSEDLFTHIRACHDDDNSITQPLNAFSA